MDMGIFQVKSNRALPAKGRILIASPLLSDYFTRTVILMITHNEEGSMGLVMNQSFRHHVTLNQLVPGLGATSDIPIFKGGPVGRDTIFFIHSLETLDGALEISDGLYLNGDFEEFPAFLRGMPDGTTASCRKKSGKTAGWWGKAAAKSCWTATPSYGRKAWTA